MLQAGGKIHPKMTTIVGVKREATAVIIRADLRFSQAG